MAASAYYAQVQKLYVAYFGRPADKLGLEYYAGLLDKNGGNDKAMLHDFANSAESKALYNQTALSAKIAAMYQSLFGRDGDLDGITYWAGQVQAGNVILSEAAAAIAFNAQTADKAAFDAKVTAATAFTAKIDTVAELTAYETNPAPGRTWLATVKDAATATSAQATIDSTLTTVVSGANTTAGQTFTLTNQTDNLTGTSGNDTFIGDNATTSAGDTLVGGAGTDTLKLFGVATVPNFSGIESVYYNAPGGSVDLSAKTEVTSIEMDTFGTFTVTAASGQAVKLTNQAAGTTATVAGSGVASLNLTLDKAGAATGDATVALTGTSLTTLNVAATGNASYVTVTNAGAKLATVNITGDKNIALQHALTTVTKIDASAATGNVTIDGVGASALAFTGGSGNDKLVAAATIGATDVLNGGAGTDTLSVSDADTIDTAAEVVGITGFEIFEAAAADATTYDLSVIGAKNTISGLVVSGDGATTTVSNINAATVGAITINADAPTVVLTAADFVSGGTSDTATINIDNSVTKNANGVDVTLTFANADVLNFKSISDGTPTKTVGGAEENSVTLTATDVEKIVISGDEAFVLTTAAGTVPTEVDASAMTAAAVTVDTDASAIASILVKGGAKNDTIDLDNAATLTTTLYTGGGSDTVVVTGGGTGAHTAIFTTTALNAGDLKAGDASTITLTGAAAGDTITLNFSSALEALLKVGGTVLGTTTGNVNVHGTTLSATTNIAAAQAANNMVIQFDLNGDGLYTATDDAQITLVGTGVNDTLVYNAAADTLVFTVVA